MSTTTKSVQPSSPQLDEATTRYVERLLDGPTPDEPWPTPAEAYVLLQELSKIRELFQKRQGELVSEGILGNGHKVKEELQGIAIVLWQARCRNTELLYGGRVDWDRLDQLKALSWRRKEYFVSSCQYRCTEPRYTILELSQKGPYIGRYIGDELKHHPNVWQLILDVATGQLTEATIRAAYGRLFEVFPVLSYPPTMDPSSCSTKEQIIRNLSAKPIYSVWELQQIAEALSVGEK
jgi:hypothetical protein